MFHHRENKSLQLVPVWNKVHPFHNPQRTTTHPIQFLQERFAIIIIIINIVI
jgi:hypothetical protein